MTRRLLISLLVAWGLSPGPALAASPDVPEAPPPVPPWRGDAVLDDPEWQKRFLGSYGVLSQREPDIQETEREILREVLALMEESPRAAAQRLAPQVGPESSASLDFILANLQFQNGQEKEAIATYRSALGKFPDFRRAHKNLALLLIQEGEFRGAVEHLTRALELGDRDGRNYGLMGYAYMHLESYLAAETAYRSAILQEPDSRDWQLGLARSLLARREYRPAIALFRSLIEEDPDDASLWLLQANAYIGSEQPREAAANIEAARMMGEAQPASLVLLGDIYMNEGVYELAKEAYLDVIRGDEAGERFETAYRAAELLVRTQSHAQAREILDTIERRYPGLPSEDELEVLTLEAKVAEAQGREQEAADLFRTIVERDGTRGEALLALAQHYREQGEPERAALMLERAQRLEDFEYRALLSHAQLRVAERDYPKAAELLRSALEIEHEPRVERFLARVEDAITPR